jgi:hypothetical protein
MVGCNIGTQATVPITDINLTGDTFSRCIENGTEVECPPQTSDTS